MPNPRRAYPEPVSAAGGTHPAKPGEQRSGARAARADGAGAGVVSAAGGTHSAKPGEQRSGARAARADGAGAGVVSAAGGTHSAKPGQQRSGARAARADGAGAGVVSAAPRDRGLWTIPNLISAARLAAVPLFLWLLLHDDRPIAAGSCSRCWARPTGSTARSPATSTRAASSARCSIPSPTGCCWSPGAVALLVEGSVPRRGWCSWWCSPARRSSASRTLGLAAAGARRIDVQWVGKAGTLALMFALPLFLLADTHERRASA